MFSPNFGILDINNYILIHEVSMWVYIVHVYQSLWQSKYIFIIPFQN